MMFLLDLKTGEVFSEIVGWNKSEASLRPYQAWSKIIYRYTIMLGVEETPASKNWEGRQPYCIPVGKPMEPEILT
jgi:hypothetical protein